MQLGQHRAGEALEQLLALIGQANKDATMIFFIAFALNQTMLGETIDQLNCAVVLDL